MITEIMYYIVTLDLAGYIVRQIKFLILANLYFGFHIKSFEGCEILEL